MEKNIIPGIVLLLIGICLLYWVGKRRFYRRGPGGLQQYSSYGKALITVMFERIVKLLGWVLVVGGLLWFLYVWKGRGKGKVAEEIASVRALVPRKLRQSPY